MPGQVGAMTWFAGPVLRRQAVLAATLLVVALTARMGFWQLDRAHEKLDLQARIEARADLPPLPMVDLARDAATAAQQYYRRITLRGHWLADRTVFLDNRQLNAHQGFFVVTPLQLASGDAVLVQRGWMPRDFNDRTRLAVLPTPSGEVLVTGRIAPPPSKLLALAEVDQGPIRQNLDLDAFASEIRLTLRPLSVQQTEPARRPELPAPAVVEPATEASAEPGPGQAVTVAAAPLAGDGLLRQWPAVAVDVSKHHGYAFQWFALSALTAGLFVWFQLLRPRRAQPRQPL